MQRLTRADRWFLIGLLVIVGLAAILRLVGIADRLHVGDDQARDLLTVKRSVETYHPFVVGPAQVANDSGAVLGPFYYYLIAPAAILAGYHPLGPTLLVAFLSILAVGGIGILGRLIHGPTAGLLSAYLMAVSSLVVDFGRFAWNPNPIVFVVVGIGLGLWAWSKGRTWGFPTTILLTFVVTQLHSTGFLMIPIVALCWLLLRLPRPTGAVLGWTLVGMVLLEAPLLYHELKHGWPTIRGYLAAEDVATTSLTFVQRLKRSWDNIAGFFLDDLVSNRSSKPLTVVSSLVALGGLWQLRRLPVGVWLIVTVLLGSLALTFYDRLIFLHYFLFLIPAVILCLSVGLSFLLRWRLGGLLVATVLISFTVVHSLSIAQTWAAIGQDDYPATEATSIVYPDVEAAVAWILATAGERSPELLFVKPTASHNQVAYDLEVERQGRVVLAWDGILIPALPAEVDHLDDQIKTLSSREPVENHLDPLYVIVQPASVPLPTAFQLLSVAEAQRFGQVRVLKIQERS